MADAAASPVTRGADPEVQLSQLVPVELMVAELILGGHPVRALVDTGATMSLIRRSLVPHCVLSNTSSSVVGLGGTQVRPLGMTTISFQLGSLHLECTCAILADGAVCHPIILATHFFKVLRSNGGLAFAEDEGVLSWRFLGSLSSA